MIECVVSGDWQLFCANESLCLVCVSFFVWKAAEPRHRFSQGRRGYWWRHARCRLVIHIAHRGFICLSTRLMRAQNDRKNKNVSPVAMVISVWLILLIMLALKCLVLFGKCIMTRALLKHKDYLYRFILEWFTSSSWQTGVRNAQISSDSQYNYSIGKTGDGKQQIVWVLSSWPPTSLKWGDVAVLRLKWIHIVSLCANN